MTHTNTSWSTHLHIMDTWNCMLVSWLVSIQKPSCRFVHCLLCPYYVHSCHWQASSEAERTDIMSMTELIDFWIHSRWSSSPTIPAQAHQQGGNKIDIETCYLQCCPRLTGICYSAEECAGVTGSYVDGRCAQGFGVCCVIRSSGGHQLTWTL